MKKQYPKIKFVLSLRISYNTSIKRSLLEEFYDTLLYKRKYYVRNGKSYNEAQTFKEWKASYLAIMKRMG